MATYDGQTGRRAQEQRRRSQFDYDALNSRGQRRSPRVSKAREDTRVKGIKRRKLSAGARDLAKNFAIAQWAIRRHLDYVATFRFLPCTDDEGFNAELKEWMEGRSRATVCDRGGRFTREKMFRHMEASRVLDGDTGLVNLQTGHALLLNADLIANPTRDYLKAEDGSERRWVEGVEIDSVAGRPRNYSIHRRTNSGTEFSRVVPARNMHLYGFFARDAADQTRGVSPFVTALNPLRDIYEGIDYSMVKWKISQLFAVKLTRKPEQSGLDDELAVDEDESEAAESSTTGPREFDLTNGPLVMDLDEDEDADVVESANPPPAFATFMDLMILIALKSIDLPYSFFNERFTNYSGQRAAWLLYERACGDKRTDQIELRTRWTIWQLRHSIRSGDLVLPSGWTLPDVRFKWVPRGMPWWKPSEEIVGDLKAIASGLGNAEEIAHNRDGDIYENLRANIKVLKYAHDLAKEVFGEDHDFRLNWDAVFPGGSNDAQVNLAE